MVEVKIILLIGAFIFFSCAPPPFLGATFRAGRRHGRGLTNARRDR